MGGQGLKLKLKRALSGFSISSEIAYLSVLRDVGPLTRALGACAYARYRPSALDFQRFCITPSQWQRDFLLGPGGEDVHVYCI